MNYNAATMTSDSLTVTDMKNNSSINAQLSVSSTTALTNAIAVSVSSSLKRKRPPKIEIPNVLREIRTDIKFTSRDCSTPLASFIGNNGVAVSSMKGKKKFMEDTHKIVSFSHANTNKGFFGVYDGHGGKKAAEFVAENLHTNILKMLEDRPESCSKEEAVKEGYLKTDQDFLKQGLGSGACCVTALIEEEEILISNLGDCRAVLCRGGVAEALTKDHRAERTDERQRIENKGGYVEIHRGAWRVHGILSVSRSIGDAHLKDWVLAEPDTKIIHLDPDMEFLVLASDGLWEEVGNQEAVDTVKQICSGGKKLGPTGDLQKEYDGEYGCVSTSPSSKLRRISLLKPQKAVSQSPNYTKNADCLNRCEDEFASENDCTSTSPSSKLWRNSLVKPQKAASQSPNHKKTADSLNRSEDDFASENDSPPPSKSRRISLFDKENTKTHSPLEENIGCMKKPAAGALVAASKELANLALRRGSMDDITVMIIDLNHFRCNNS